MSEKETPDSKTWEKIEEIYHTALNLDDETRDAYVMEACTGDPVLYEEIVSLITSDSSSGKFLQQPLVDYGFRILADNHDWQSEMSLSPTIASDDLFARLLDNRYEIIERIGGGGMGDVYRARDTKMLNRPVVVKVLKEAATGSEWLVSKFKQEIEASNKIDNSGVVSFFDIGELPDGKPYLVMQFVEGRDLRKSIPADRGMPLDEVAEIIKQLGRTLTIAHDKGIIHRDLKPENIMYRRDDNGDLHVKVIDFGIAKIKDSVVAASTATNLIVGTRRYMSPEQLNPELLHHQRVSAASDIYSLGVIAYEMVTGRRPYNAESDINLAALQKEGVKVMPCALRPALPEAAQRVILKALSYHPAERYQRARDFSEELSQALSADHQPALPPIPTGSQKIDDRSRPQPSKKSALLLAVTIPLLIMALVAAGLWWKYYRPGPERIFSYSLKIQKMRNGQPFEEPFISPGTEIIYEKGYKFQLLMNSQSEGYVYLFAEGKDSDGRRVLNILFPTPARNGGAARIAAGAAFETGWNTFDGQTGTESVWMVWTARPQAELEEARTLAFRSPKGQVTDEALVNRLRAILNREEASRVEAVNDVQQQSTVLHGHGDVMPYLITLEYR
jgi:serine/threonine protein kinase